MTETEYIQRIADYVVSHFCEQILADTIKRAGGDNTRHVADSEAWHRAAYDTFREALHNANVAGYNRACREFQEQMKLKGIDAVKAAALEPGRSALESDR